MRHAGSTRKTAPIRRGRTIELAWAVVEARTGNDGARSGVLSRRRPRPVGARRRAGHGQRLSDINRNRDLIFLDQRGTGGSNALECEFDEDTFLVEPDLDEINELLRQCHDALDADVRHYTTIDGAEDLEMLREHLGLDGINLVGGSYGTRMAQVYLRRHPEAVRAVIIDGVVPTRLKLGSEHAEMLDRSIEKLLQRCMPRTTPAASISRTWSRPSSSSRPATPNRPRTSRSPIRGPALPKIWSFPTRCWPPACASWPIRRSAR